MWKSSSWDLKGWTCSKVVCLFVSPLFVAFKLIFLGNILLFELPESDVDLKKERKKKRKRRAEMSVFFLVMAQSRSVSSGQCALHVATAALLLLPSRSNQQCKYLCCLTPTVWFTPEQSREKQLWTMCKRYLHYYYYYSSFMTSSSSSSMTLLLHCVTFGRLKICVCLCLVRDEKSL